VGTEFRNSRVFDERSPLAGKYHNMETVSMCLRMQRVRSMSVSFSQELRTPASGLRQPASRAPVTRKHRMSITSADFGRLLNDALAVLSLAAVLGTVVYLILRM
jgi:hypothetical protein